MFNLRWIPIHYKEPDNISQLKKTSYIKRPVWLSTDSSLWISNFFITTVLMGHHRGICWTVLQSNQMWHLSNVPDLALTTTRLHIRIQLDQLTTKWSPNCMQAVDQKTWKKSQSLKTQRYWFKYKLFIIFTEKIPGY